MNKRLLLAVVVVLAFFLGYGFVAKAWPYMGRQPYYGYFLNDYDAYGADVWEPNTGPAACRGTGLAMHTGINTKSEFINFVKCKLGGNTQEIWGARFIIQTMRGGTDHTAPSSADITDWENRVNNPDVIVDWGSSILIRSWTINSYYQGTGSGANPKDDAFYADSDSSNYVVRFIEGGVEKYKIRRVCANPVGELPGLPANPAFNITGYSNVSAPGIPAGSNIEVPPGTLLTWTHQLRSGNNTSPQTIDWTTHSQSGVQYASGSVGTMAGGVYETANVYTFTAPATIGSVHCRYIHWFPDTQVGGSGDSIQACATVVADYDLNAITSITSGSTIVQQGDTVQFTYRISNSGGGASPSANCYVRDGADALVTVPGLACPQSFPGNTTSPPTTVGTENVTVGTEAPGTTICRRLFVSPATSSISTRASTLQCVVVAKAPYVHFMGGDVWAGGGIINSSGTCTTNSNAKITTSSKQSASAGSVVEYAAFALSTITRFGSGSKPLYNSADFADLGRRLTFANNTATLGVFGAPQHCIDDYAADYESATASGSTSISVGAACNRTLHLTAGSVTFTGAGVPVGCKQAYLAEGDVTISGNLQYISGSPSYVTPADIPSLLIIAKGNIFVNEAVSAMNGIFVARNTFYTCYPKPSPPTVNTCSTLLTVNGAVIAGTLDLYRTRGAAGATPAERQQPAEIFNLRPEVFLNNVLNTSSQPTLTTSETRELPPRF